MSSAYIAWSSSDNAYTSMGGDPTTATAHLQAKLRQSGVGGVTVDIPKHLPLVETHPPLVF